MVCDKNKQGKIEHLSLLKPVYLNSMYLRVEFKAVTAPDPDQPEYLQYLPVRQTIAPDHH